MSLRVEIRDWKINREVELVETIGTSDISVRSFYTTATELEIREAAGLIPQDPQQAREGFRLLEAKLPPPHIGGQFAPFHPYWKEHGWEVER